jgi:peroxiredoxin Q/BCP
MKEGDEAPDFDLESDTGERVRLRDLRGRTVVLYFYPKDDTPGCTIQACDFRDRAGAFAEREAVVLGVSPDGLPEHEKFRDKHGLNYRLLSDPEHAVAEAYGAWGLRKMYGREFEGILRSTFIIDPEGRIARAYRDVRPEGHADRLLAEL